MKTDDKCQECKKDWTKCGRCPVTMEWVKEHRMKWVKEHRKEHVESEG